MTRTLVKLAAALAVSAFGLVAYGQDSSTSNTPKVNIANVLAAVDQLKGTLTTSQISTLQVDFNTTNAAKWSNLPVGAASRNGLRFDSLTTDQLAAALNLAQVALSTSSSGYDRFSQIRLADANLSANGGGNQYGSNLYFVAILGAPSTNGQWMLQFGGHHIAFNLTFNGSRVSSSPYFVGVEPKSFVANGVTYTPLETKRSAMASLIQSLTTTQLASAKLGSNFSDVYLGPGKDSKSYFPTGTTGRGILATSLSTAQQALMKTAIAAWINDEPGTSAFQTTYERGLSQTYVAYSGTTALTTQGDYVRIDGPRCWIEFVCQNGIFYQGQIHFHTVMRDRVTDYGNDLTF